MSISTTYANHVLDAILGDDHTADFPATVYVALYTESDVELSGTGYARVAVTNNSTNWPNASGGLKANGTDITFPAATGSWGTASKVKLMSASSGGSEVIGQNLNSARLIAAGSTPKFDAGDLEFGIV